MNLLISLFWNKEEERLRATFRILITFASYFLISAFLAKAVRLFIDYPSEFNGATPLWVILILLAFRFARLFIIYISAKYIDKRPFSDLGITMNKTWWTELFFGLALGAIAMSGIFAFQLSLDWIAIKDLYHVFDADGSFLLSLTTYFIFLLVASTVEEFFYRGYLLQNIAEGLNFKNNPNKAIIFALFFSSVLEKQNHNCEDAGQKQYRRLSTEEIEWYRHAHVRFLSGAMVFFHHHEHLYVSWLPRCLDAGGQDS